MVGGVVALWAGTAVVSAAQTAMDDVWDVPRAERPGLVRRVTRALILLLVFGGSIAASTFLTGIEMRTGWTSVVWESLFLLLSVAISVGVFAFAYRMLTVANVRWKDVLPGASSRRSGRSSCCSGAGRGSASGRRSPCAGRRSPG